MGQILAQPQDDGLGDLPDLPPVSYTVDKQRVETASLIWEARVAPDGGPFGLINWLLTMPAEGANCHFSGRSWHLVKLYLADRLSQKNFGTVCSDFRALLALDRWLAEQDLSTVLTGKTEFGWDDYNEALARAFLDHLVTHTGARGRVFSQIRTFYHWGVANQFSDFSSDFLQLLRSIKAPSNYRGHNVRFHNIHRGPFSPEEKQAIKDALDRKAGTLQDRAIVRLHYELGINPHAIMRLHNRDIIFYEAKGTTYYHLDIPRVKKRTNVRETKRRPISPELGALLSQLQQGDPDAPLIYWLPIKRPHIGIAGAMSRFVKTSRIVSLRTHKPLHLSPRRFRYTLATHLAEEGASDMYIAELLDHSDLSNTRVYRETSSLIAEQVAKATDSKLTPLVHRFLGILVDQIPARDGLLDQVIPGTTPHLSDAPLDIGAIGGCGREVKKEGLCRLFPPLSCYNCRFFAALRTGPHQQLLQSLENYLETHREQMDKRIALQLEGVLSTIRQVILQIHSPSDGQKDDSHEQQ